MTPVRSKPIAFKIGRLLRDRIRDGVYVPGQRLPSEPEMAKELGVSRATLRTALAQLSAENLISRKQGDGTFVSNYAEDVNTTLGGMLDFWRLIAAGGRKPSIQTISLSERAATEYEASVLGLTDSEEIVSMIRLLLADEVPVILATNIIPKLEFLEGETLYDGRLELRHFAQRYCQRQIDHAIFNAKSALAVGISAEFLELLEGAPLLQLEATFFDHDNTPFIYGTSYLNDRLLDLRFVQTWN